MARWPEGSIIAAMVFTLGAVSALALWDSRREAAAALEDFGDSQGLLAQSVAGQLGARLASVERDAQRLASGAPATEAGEPYLATRIRPRSEPRPALGSNGAVLISVPVPEDRRADLEVSPSALFSEVGRIERANALAVWFLPPDSDALLSTDGRRVRLDELRSALEGGDTTVRLSGASAEAASLPRRTALAGLAHANVGGLGRWGVAVVASAAREREREARAQTRLLWTLLLGAVIVSSFGGFALRKTTLPYRGSYRSP
jgi:hypothetical protein